MLYISMLGVVIEARTAEGHPIQAQRVVSWHDIEQGLYDALRIGLDKVVRELGFSV